MLCRILSIGVALFPCLMAADEPAARVKPPDAEQEAFVVARIAENEQDWVEVPTTEVVPGQRRWRARPHEDRTGRYIPEADVVLRVGSFSGVDEAKAEMVQMRLRGTLVRIGDLKDVGDEAQANTGYAVPGLTTLHCRVGRFVFSLTGPSTEVVVRFARQVAAALATVPEAVR